MGSEICIRASYVSRYIMKKVNGDQAEEHYRRFNPETGEVWYIRPEYTTMSRARGIGYEWLQQYMSDVYPSDYVIMKEQKMRPPKFYDNIFELEYPEEFATIKQARIDNALKHDDNNTPERLAVREKLQHMRLDKLIRPLSDQGL